MERTTFKHPKPLSTKTLDCGYPPKFSGTTFLFTYCQDDTPPVGNDYSQTYLVHGSEVLTELEQYGCESDLDVVFCLGLGESVALGFPQATYTGIIVTRIR